MTAAPSSSVRVGGLDPQVTEQTLYEHFTRIGPLLTCRVVNDQQTQKSLGYGYVNFQNPADAEKALDQTGVKLLNKSICVARIQRDSTLRRSGASNIVVKRLTATMDEAGLKEIFSKFGRLTSVLIPVDDATGAHRGFAYVAFEKEDSAVQAVQEINGMVIDGTAIAVDRYRKTHSEDVKKQFKNLYVKNLGASVTSEQLKATFEQFGTVTSAQVRMDPNGQSMGFGWAAFDKHEDAANAVESLNEKAHELAKEGEQLVVRRFQSKVERLKARDRAKREQQIANSKFPNIYVKQFDEHITSEDLKAAFEKCGPTVSCRVMYDPTTKVSKAFGFVSMRDQAGADKAMLELNGSLVLGNRPLFLTRALKRDARRQALDDSEKRRQPRGQMPDYRNQMPMDYRNQMPMNMPSPMFPGAQMHNPMQRAQMQMQMQRPPQQQQQYPMGQPMQSPQQFQQPMNRQPMMNPMGMQGMQNPMMQNPMMQNPMMQNPMARMPPKPTQPHPMQMQQPAQTQSLASLLASMNPEQQKNVLGERLYNYILRRHPSEAAKVTGMLLEMDNAEILNLLDTSDLLDGKIAEALEVLQRHSNM